MPSNQLAAYGLSQFSADCITNTSGFSLRQGQDDAINVFIREGLQIRYDREQIGKALAPLFEDWLRAARNRKLPIFNLFSQRR